MIWLLIIMEIGLFIAGIYLINKYDKEAGIQVSKKEYVTMGLIFAMTEIVLFSFYGYGREFGCHSLVLFYLIIAAYIDHKTRTVYRIGSVSFILASAVIFFWNAGINIEVFFTGAFSILIASLIVFLQGRTSMMGWGDVLTYIGTFFYLASWEYTGLQLERMAIYMLLSNIVFLILNIRKFDWKTKKFREEAAFLPSMAVAMMIMELSRISM